MEDPGWWLFEDRENRVRWFFCISWRAWTRAPRYLDIWSKPLRRFIPTEFPQVASEFLFSRRDEKTRVMLKHGFWRAKSFRVWIFHFDRCAATEINIPCSWFWFSPWLCWLDWRGIPLTGSWFPSYSITTTIPTFRLPFFPSSLSPSVSPITFSPLMSSPPSHTLWQPSRRHFCPIGIIEPCATWLLLYYYIGKSFLVNHLLVVYLWHQCLVLLLSRYTTMVRILTSVVVANCRFM